MTTPRIIYFTILSGLLALPVVALGQTSAAGIAGDVRDTSGAVLPGVTVEASSPALIEKVRTVVTDAAGRYNIVELRPGTYSVTFTLPGFSTVRREGIELVTGFTATVNAEMKVGEVQETITVTGAAPAVDVRNTQQQRVLTTQVLDTLPVARGFQGFGALTPGVVTSSTMGMRDVGGNTGDWAGSLTIHGVRGSGWVAVDGLDTRSLLGDGIRRQEINYGGIQEVVLNTAAPSAEQEAGGVSVNFVPKEGGNTFRGTLFGDYTGDELQSANLNDDLRTRGLTRPSSSTKFVFDVYGGLGGPIVKDRLWFYTAHRWKGTRQELAGTYYNKLQGTLFYEPDLSRPAFTERPTKQYYNERFTWQAAAKHKVTLTMSDEDNCFCGGVLGASRDPAAAWWGHLGQLIIQPGWTYTATNRLLLEAGFSRRAETSTNKFATDSGVTKNDRAVFDLALGRWYGSLASGANPSIMNVNGWLNDYGTNLSKMWSARAALSYVSGSHAFKTGFTNYSGWLNYGPGTPNFPEAYQLRDRVPVGLWQLASPGFSRGALKTALGLYAQDVWTAKKLTLNLGLRFDYINAYSPETVRPGGVYVPELRFAPVYNLPNWKDFNPRLGLAYDVFGNGRTAFKASFGRYVVTQATRIAQEANPADSITGTVFRTWSDVDGDYVPDCDLKSPLANGECGTMADQRFGTSVVTRRYAPDYLTGWGERGYNWQASASVQHELTPRLALNVGYYRTTNLGLQITDNLAITPANFDPFCITAPIDSRLPGGGGNQICGLYDITPAKFGAVDNLVSKSDDLRDIYNGVDLSVNARFGQGGTLFGGASLGQRTVDNCVVVDTPDQRFCKTSDAQKQVKLAGTYPFPWGVRVSATFQNLPGIDRTANLVVGNAQVAPSLERNLGACRGAAICSAVVVVPLIEPGTLREPRQNQLDVRLSKLLRQGSVRIEPKFEVFNVFNANDPQGLVNTYGPRWLHVTSILAGRLFKFGAQVDF